MSVERSISRSMPFLPRYRSLSSSSRHLPRFPTVRSLSQPSQRIVYVEGTVTKCLAHARPSHSPSPQRVHLLCASKTKGSLSRTSSSGTSSDLLASHVFTTLERTTGDQERPQIEVDARATSVADIYHKGPFYPDATQSESGVSMNESQDSSSLFTEDDNTSQFSYGSSSAFHEITIDSELDRLDSEDGMRSPRGHSSFRFRDPLSPDSNRSSPFPYADARKRELMSSPSWDFDKTQSRHNALRVLIPAPDGSVAKDRLARKDSGGSSSSTTPLAQSTPHVSPRSFMGPRLSIKGSWNVDDPYDEVVTDDDVNSTKRVDDSRDYSSYSEDNLSDVSPSKHDRKSARKVKLTKKTSDLPAKRSDFGKVTAQRQDQLDKTLISEESFENIYIPPLESVIGVDNEDATAGHGGPTPNESEGNASWWEVFNIESADARRSEEDIDRKSPDTNSKPDIKIVKPAKKGIPLISAGKHGKEKLKRLSQSSPPPGMGTGSPVSPTSLCLSDGNDESNEVIDNNSVQDEELILKRDCRERAMDVLRKTAKGLNISGSGAFNFVRASSRDAEDDDESLTFDNSTGFDDSSTSINDKTEEFSTQEKDNVDGMNSQNQGEQAMENKLETSQFSLSSLPCIPPLVAALSSQTSEDANDEEKKRQQAVDDVIEQSQHTDLQYQQTCALAPSVSPSTNSKEGEYLQLDWDPTNQSYDEMAAVRQPIPGSDDVDDEDDGSDDKTQEAFNSRHYVLDNSNTRGQGAEAQAAVAIFATLDIPGGENTQVGVEEEPGMVGVGGSRCSSCKSSSNVDLPALQEEASDPLLTTESDAPGIASDNNYTEFTTCTPSTTSTSVESSGQCLNGFVQQADNDGVVLSVNEEDKEFDQLCSTFSIVLNISEPTKSEEPEKKSLEENHVALRDNIIQPYEEKSVAVSLEVKQGNKTDEQKHCDSELNSKSDTLLISVDALAPSQELSGKEETIVNSELEILSGNVGLEEANPTHISSPQALSESTLDPDTREANGGMEWRFIDPRLGLAGGKSFGEGRKERVNEIDGGGIKGPFVVSVLATAELPPRCATDDERREGNPSWQNNPNQTSDGFSQENNSHQIHPELATQQLNNNNINCFDNNIPLQSEPQFHDAHDFNSRNISQTTTATNPTLITLNQKRENFNGNNGNTINEDGSIKYPDSEGEGHDMRGDKGIPQFEKTTAQNKDGERQWRSEQEFLSFSPIGTESDDWAGTDKPGLSQQVKHIHRKTVEETVTIERSSCTKSSSCTSEIEGGYFGDSNHSVEVITNRTKTVIQEEDQIFTSSGPVSHNVFSSPQINEKVSSSRNEEFNPSRENPSFSAPHHFTNVTPGENDIDESESPPPLPSTPPPPLSPVPEPMIIDETPVTQPTYLSPPPHILSQSDAGLSQFDPDPTQVENTAMKWRGILTTTPTSQQRITSFDPSLDPSNTIDGQDNSMAKLAERGTTPAYPVTHHSPLDHLQAQLSQISDGLSLDVSPSPSHANVYHDHGKAVTHMADLGVKATSNANITQNTSNGLGPSSSNASAINSDSGKPNVESYDNDYDYVTCDDKSNGLLHSSRQHQLLKSGQQKASSLWTLKEETDSLLDALSPIASPKRHFTNITAGDMNHELTLNNNEKAQQQIFNAPLRPVPLSMTPQRHYVSESSDFDESDGNYSSISTADSSSYRSSGYGREQTPLSDSDNGISGDNGADRMNYGSQPSQSQGQTVDGLSSFNDFVSGLVNERFASDSTNKSYASASANGVNQQMPINFGDSTDADPTAFKSSVSFCVNAAPRTVAGHNQDISLERLNESISYSTFQSSNNIPRNSSQPHATHQLSVNSSSRSGAIPPFPVDVSSASSTYGHSDDSHSEASSRLYTLDLDLSRISSCASPTPSDFSDVAMFTCKGTAEIKRIHSVSFEDDYDMVPVSHLQHIPHLNSTPKPLKSVLKKPTKVVEEVSQQSKDSFHEIWVKQFDKMLEDFNTKTSAVGPGSEVMVVEDTSSSARRGSVTSQGSNMNDLYKAFSNDDSEKRQNHLCPVIEDDNASTFRFKRFLKKSHTKRSNKGRRLVRFLSRLSCVSESVQSPDLSATRKKARLDNGQAYGTDFMPPLPDRDHLAATMSPVVSQSPRHHQHAVKDSPTSSNHSLDSCPSRTDSAYSSVSESLSGILGSPKESGYSSRLPTNSFSSVSSHNGSFQQTDSSDQFYSDSVHSSTSDYASLHLTSDSSDPFSPKSPARSGKYSKEMLTALSDVFDQLDVCEGEIDTALLDRLRCGHQSVHFSKDA